MSLALSPDALSIAVASAIARASGGSFGYREAADGREVLTAPPADYRRSKSDMGPNRHGSTHQVIEQSKAEKKGLFGAMRKGLGRLANGLRSMPKRMPSPKRSSSPRRQESARRQPSPRAR